MLQFLLARGLKARENLQPTSHEFKTNRKEKKVGKFRDQILS
jgi:hypothetical protein